MSVRSPVRVSVVVAVYNPGPYLEGLIGSLERQTMPPGEWEAIFVDDGSTDGSATRLDRLAAEHSDTRVIHIPNSGWSGRPRNVGIDAAVGEYVYIVDHDDWLGAEALERVVERADRTGADVLIPKEVGHGFGVPLVMFRHNVDDASLEHDPLQALLTPHKLFRRSMLIEHEIRFPEGRRRLEDHHFVMHTYLHARRISILADYPCYHWTLRRDRSNATHSRVDWSSYFDNLGTILDGVQAHLAAGELRDRLFRHWLRAKTLHKLHGRRWYEPPMSAASHDLFSAARSIIAERFDPRLDGALPIRYRVLARAARDDRLDLVAAHARFSDEMGASIEAIAIEPREWGIDLSLRCALTDADGAPLRFARVDGGFSWLPPVPIAGHPALRREDLDATDDLSGAIVNVILRHRASRTEYVQQVPMPHEELADGSVVLAGNLRASLDLETFAAGTPLSDGSWDLLVQIEALGWWVSRNPSGISLPGESPTEWVARPYVNQGGGLSIAVRGSSGPMLEAPPRIDLPPAPAPTRDGPTSRMRLALRRLVPMPARRAARALALRITR